jgi:glycosyltransferase involved in cell wall biosynthesis
MIPERFPDLFAEGNPHGRKQEAIARAGLILAISEHTKRDLLELHPEIRVPVVVTPLAVDHSRFSSSGTPADGDTILFVGDRGSYKNFSVFAHAAAKLLRERPDLRVLCLGGGTLTSEERLPFVQLDVASRIVQMRISDEDLPQLYREALAFVFPSRYEGFGLPILEAFASGCPAILANASCFPEIATDAAAYFNPLVADELLEVLRRVTSDSSYRSELRRKGILRARDFSWNQTAQRTAEAYRALAEQAI